ncbi:MAG: Uncharacterized protein Greene041614_1104 [Parcubacteria group bacterium Greene0416_14]|nr:MAG: Uncharacterized protein Greene041614_1104 [Parcubacteria group bacterium Greene0416_14]
MRVHRCCHCRRVVGAIGRPAPLHHRPLFWNETSTPGGCPICLSGDTMIDTPLGEIQVKEMKTGMPVWTVGKDGTRTAGTIKMTGRTPVPQTHEMVRLILNDGRQLLVSPGHSTTDGRTIGGLVANDFYDNARVLSADRVPYTEEATYDILPSGETGWYRANGILLKSTL